MSMSDIDIPNMSTEEEILINENKIMVPFFGEEDTEMSTKQDSFCFEMNIDMKKIREKVFYLKEKTIEKSHSFNFIPLQ
jgi:hypothetical protein